jgi:hypothetical protein
MFPVSAHHLASFFHPPFNSYTFGCFTLIRWMAASMSNFPFIVTILLHRQTFLVNECPAILIHFNLLITDLPRQIIMKYFFFLRLKGARSRDRTRNGRALQLARNCIYGNPGGIDKGWNDKVNIIWCHMNEVGNNTRMRNNDCDKRKCRLSAGDAL